MTKPKFIDRVLENIRERSLLLAEDPVIIGLSGGPDSMALAHSFYQLRERGDLAGKITLAHLEHPFQEDTSFDEKQKELCQAFAKEKGLSLEISAKDVLSQHRRQGGSLEELGRRARYTFFGNTALKLGCCHVALGHQKDDQVETLLHRLLRGAGLKGLRGIPWKREIVMPFSEEGDEKIWVIRPLLNLSRQEIFDYLEEEKVPYLSDYANLNLQFFRNRIRREILPYLEGHQPQMGKRLLELGIQASWAHEFIQREVETLENQISRDSFGALLIPEAFGELPKALLSELLRKILASMESSGSFAEIEGFLEHLKDLGPFKWDFRKGVRVEREGRHFSFFRPSFPSGPEATFLKIPGTTLISSDEKIQISWESTDSFERELSSLKEGWQGVVFLDRSKVVLPLVVRRRREGDLFRPLGSPGRKKVKKVFIDRKIPSRIRDFLWVLEDGKKRVVALEGVGISEEVKVEASTDQVLRVEFVRH